MASSFLIISKYQNMLVLLIIIMKIIYVQPQLDYENSLQTFGFINNFETNNNSQIIAQIGGKAILPCVINYKTPATISWIKDHHLLTVGLATYSSDDRFIVEHTRHEGTWDLLIKPVQKEDQGLYKCQISTHPPQSIFIELKVVEAIAEISATTDIHIDEGSTLKLECKIKQATENPSYVFWYHNNKMVNYDSMDGYTVSTFETKLVMSNSPSLNNNDKSSVISSYSSLQAINQYNLRKSQQHQDQHYIAFPQQQPIATSILFIKEAKFKHAGNYTCAPSNTRPTSVNVHVLKDEKPAAMQHANQSSTINVKSHSYLTLNSAMNRILCIGVLYFNHLQLNR
ncbi:unnamed protein product [Diamesa serratosioi]